ncbi:bifunctional methylenetetrahydrofolate dehydrogenase/methenyltetrahydrofolate cyclohydrolase FolD [Rhodococcus opacus]|uniref:bifunctional methylenetetrahydrofolate dehydrogenase/methenyltetrahydrofolate cyclohydrolase FolD n=1 Tax=Rhodococcus opacus TaxID=37919 RepID=UPI000EA957DE|nr:bifunctional methylenetetrahydrofolate dehydrogenase/methenyltetrahydrofolate cyclohydrolase FolD [Rhodococcus opacus]QZS56857.1 bifunctional methylenetetrahydrofolate dehydrogenase/methenyltetrahydrofolate cyclohydrolase FolD [Rhodococcus opacus]RKM76518.1 bifunctional methylenetetrahydrofolate dehydrogenase/methenyltetrahydrofolate cyclohydrolase FolD [Rhodococcus opacus]
MTARLIDGKAVARAVRDEVAELTRGLLAATGRRPGLATVLVGEDPASQVYVASKRKACVAAGMADLHRHLPASVSQSELEEVIDSLAEDPEVSGILLQLPVPGHLDTDALINRIPPAKDVDGLTTLSAGQLIQDAPGLRPCTPSGVIALLDAYEIPIRGAHAVVVGRSPLVGKPMAQLLLARDATVTICHSRTPDLGVFTAQADIVIAAAGVPGLVDASSIKPGATVIDVGIHRTREGLRGDVDFESVRTIAGALTPVPGGVGPVTIAMLLRNTFDAAQHDHAGAVLQ